LGAKKIIAVAILNLELKNFAYQKKKGKKNKKNSEPHDNKDIKI